MSKNNKTLMDVVHPVAAGIDIASKQYDVTIVKHQGDALQPDMIYQKFGYSTQELYRLRDFLVEHECFHVCMESTGHFWMALFTILEEVMTEVRVVNPKYVKAIKNRKDDRRDSEWLAHQYRLGLTENSYIPARTIRDMRQLVRLRKKLIRSRASFANRRIKHLRRNNVTLEKVFKDLSGKSAQRIIHLILEGDFTDEEVIACIDYRCKASHGDIIAAARGIEMSIADRFLMESIERCIRNLNEEIERISRQISSLIKQNCAKQIRLLCSVPGIAQTSAEVILSEVGFDVSHFKSAAHLVSWAGLCPSCNQSGGKQITTHISKAGKNLKPVLVQCAQAARRSSDYYKSKYESISSRQGKKRAIIAIARKLLVALWHILRKEESWNPTDQKEARQSLEKAQRESTEEMKKAISKAARLGRSKDEIAVEMVTALNETFHEIT